MAESILPFKYEQEKSDPKITTMAGLPLYLELGVALGMPDSMDKHLSVRKTSQGHTDTQSVCSLLMLNIAGGDCVDDIELLEADKGLCRILKKVDTFSQKSQGEDEFKRRWPVGKPRTVPAPSSIFRYLGPFHDSEQELQKQQGSAFIQRPNEHLKALGKVNRDFVKTVWMKQPVYSVILEMDAMLLPAEKRETLFCYEGFKCYQPLNVWCHELQMMVYTEFRDGNVPAGFQQLRVLKEALTCLPKDIEKIQLRVDTAGYEWELLFYCESGKNPTFGRIEFCVGCDVTPAFREAVSQVSEDDWETFYDAKGVKSDVKEYAELCFVPNALCSRPSKETYRFLVTREVFHPKKKKKNKDLPFQVMEISRKQYKIFGYVTNMKWDGLKLLHWNYKRCGYSEQAHERLKGDLAGGKMPTGNFGSNAAWWWIAVLALNLYMTFNRLVLGGAWRCRKLKALRFHLIRLKGRVISHDREFVIVVEKGHPSYFLICHARKQIMNLYGGPSP